MINTVKVKQVIKGRGVKFFFLASELGCSEKTLYNYLNGETTPPETFKQELADILGVSVNTLN